MKIGIDARFLTHPQVGGFKTYTVNLIRALSQIDHDNHYVLYIDRPPTEENALPQSVHFTYQVVPAKLSVIGVPFREQVLLRRQIARDKLDVVHFLCNTAPIRLPENSILSLLDVIQVKTGQDFPTSTTFENYRRWAMTRYSKWTILNTVKKVKKVITLSHFEEREIVKHLDVAPERIHVTYFGINPAFTQANPQNRETLRAEVQQKHGVGRRFIMGVGYEPRKNIPLLIEAFARIAPTHPDLDLVIVAAEKERSLFFRQLATKLDLNDRMVVLDALQSSDLAVLYNLAEVFVFPSERESFGAPPLEALACGAPTVAMNMTSLPEILADGALLVDTKDVDVWANAISSVIDNAELRASLIKRGLDRARQFSWQRCAAKTVEVYRMVHLEPDNSE